MEHKKIDVLILGGGITGLSLASFLKNRDYLILEKETEVGGYCKSTLRNGYVWDYSGHFFHFNDNDTKNYLIENIDCEILKVKKNTKIYYKDKLIDFPFQYNINQLDNEEFLECLYDFYNRKNLQIDNFKSFVKNILGDAICKKFIIPYNEKLYSCDLNELDFDCMGRFFPKKIEYSELLELLKNKSNINSYNDEFIYPVNGSYEFIKSLLKRIDNEKINTDECVLEIDLENKIVVTDKNMYKFNSLVNTLPFNLFLKLSNKSTEFNLSYNRVKVFNLGFDGPTNIKNHWIYFPNDEPFYRVGFYNNILSQEKLSLYVEVSLSKENHSNVNLKQIIDGLKEVGIVTNQNLVDSEELIMSPAYVHITKNSKKIYSDWSEEHNKNSIFSIGRYGGWTYCSLEDNIIDSKKISEILNYV